MEKEEIKKRLEQKNLKILRLFEAGLSCFCLGARIIQIKFQNTIWSSLVRHGKGSWLGSYDLRMTETTHFLAAVNIVAVISSRDNEDRKTFGVHCPREFSLCGSSVGL